MSDARLSHLFVHVASLNDSRRFYVELLGLDVLLEEPGYLRVGNADGWHIGMEEAQPMGAEGIEINIRVSDVDAVYARLINAGVAFEATPTDTDWGARHAWLRDPSGYRVSIYS